MRDKRQSADIIINSEAIFDSVGDAPFAGFVAIAGNRIVGVGPKEEAKMFASPHTVQIDAGRNLVMPGFHDSHTHLILAGMYKCFVNMGSARSEEEAAKMLCDFETAHPTDGWVYGFNWYHVYWDVKELPRKETLDRYFPDRPVILLNAEAHGAWVNSKALEIAGITKNTQNPFGGEIARGLDGEATGFLYESAIALVGKHSFDLTMEQERHFLKAYMDTAAPLGITSLVDVQPYFGANLGKLSTYRAMEQNQELTVRIHAASNLFGDLEQAVLDAALCTGEKVRANLLKQFVDGVPITHTALMLEDYTDAPGNKGFQLCELDRIADGIMEGHRLELSVKIHAIGDRAIRFTLDCFENAIKTYGKNKARHAIEHVETVTSEDILRFGVLGIIPSVQPEHLGLMPTWEGEEYRYVLGEERAGRTWPFKSLLEAAGVLAIGSDCPVVDNNPFYEIHRGVTRIHDDGLPVNGWNPSEKLTVAELIKGYTFGSAYSVSRESELGTLETGKLADIVILDRNLFEVSPQEIREANVVTTIMDGNIIYSRRTVEI